MTESGTANTKETLACLIIDDPLLKPRYGCFDYKRLLEEMKTHNFFTEIAFISYNYRRSKQETVRLFADNPDRFAICVHGCNHLSNEFGGQDYQQLKSLASTALWRMEEHKKITGLPYDPVIVFPQGKFSSVAMKALKDEGYFAAFNSTTCRLQKFTPIFLCSYGAIRRKNLISCKTSSLAGRSLSSSITPLSKRDTKAFKEGYKAITDVVDWINSLGNIRWTSLLSIAEHYLGNKAPIIEQRVKPSRESLGMTIKVALRRFLSEARDNHIETSNLLSKAYKMLRG